MPKKMDISGNLGEKSASAESAHFHRKIKRAGRTGSCAKPLTYRKPAIAIEGKFGPGDSAS